MNGIFTVKNIVGGLVGLVIAGAGWWTTRVEKSIAEIPVVKQETAILGSQQAATAQDIKEIKDGQKEMQATLNEVIRRQWGITPNVSAKK